MGKKTQLVYALGLISLGVFIVTSVLNTSCPNNANIPDEKWQKIGDNYCIYAQNVNQLLTNFVDLIRNTFA